MLTRDNIKLRSDFPGVSEYVDYLESLCKLDLSRPLILGRIGRGFHPYDAITKQKILKPASNHPYRRFRK
jgi:hypothetical protein